MTDLQLLFLVLALIYGWECACWISRGAMFFRTWIGFRWRALQPGWLLGNQRGGFLFSPPLPPLGTVLATAEFPLSAIEGFVARLSGASASLQPIQASNSLDLVDEKNVAARGKKVLIKNQVLIKTGSAAYAMRLAGFLRQLAAAKPADRERLLTEQLRESFNTRRIESVWLQFRKQTGVLRLVTNMLFIYLFIAVPWLIQFFGFSSTWLLLLIGLLLLTSSIAVLFYRSHKEFFPEAADDRFTHFVIFLLSPATAIRALDALSRPLFEGCHPLAVAKVFCREPAFRILAQRIWRELQHPAERRGANVSTSKRSAEAPGRQGVQKELEKLLRQSGLKPDELLRPPAPADETCVSYCPRCLSQFTTPQGVCPDCGGLPLAPLLKR